MQQAQKQHYSVRMLTLRKILVNRVQTFIRASYAKIHFLVGTFLREMQVQVAEKQCHIVKCVSHRSHISVVQCDDSERVSGLIRAMYAIKFSLVALS
jgi:hypothetical protein